MSFETLYLGLVVAAFSAFALTLSSVSIWSATGGKR
jgi:hypothetical protein